MIQKNKKSVQKNKNFNKQQFNNKNNNYTYSNKKYTKYKSYIGFNQKEKKPEKPKITAYLYKNKKLKKGIFFKKPTFNDILYPFPLNLKLINEYLKKK